MQRFRSMKTLQKLSSVHAQVPCRARAIVSVCHCQGSIASSSTVTRPYTAAMGNADGRPSDPTPWHGHQHSISLTVPPLAVVFFKPERRRENKSSLAYSPEGETKKLIHSKDPLRLPRQFGRPGASVVALERHLMSKSDCAELGWWRNDLSCPQTIGEVSHFARSDRDSATTLAGVLDLLRGVISGATFRHRVRCVRRNGNASSKRPA